MWKTFAIASLLLVTPAFADGGTPPVVVDNWIGVPGVTMPASPLRARMFNEVTGTEGERVWFPMGVRTEALALPPAAEVAPIAPPLAAVAVLPDGEVTQPAQSAVQAPQAAPMPRADDAATTAPQPNAADAVTLPLPDMLPKTASALPAIALFGFSALLAALFLEALRRSCVDSY